MTLWPAMLVYTIVNTLISIGAYKLGNKKAYTRFAAIVLAILAGINLQSYLFFLISGILTLLILELYFYKKKTAS